jgi:hypothetical protein
VICRFDFHLYSYTLVEQLAYSMGHRWNLGFIPYGNTWRRGRKIIHSETHAIAATTHRPVLLCGARQFVCDLLAAEKTRPADKLSEASKKVLPQLVRRSFAFTAVRMIYGIKVCDPIAEARYVDVPEKVLHALNEGATPGRFLVDYIPICTFVYRLQYTARIHQLIIDVQCDTFPIGSPGLTFSDLPENRLHYASKCAMILWPLLKHRWYYSLSLLDIVALQL